MYSIYAESTPNPEVMKFVANRVLTNKIIEISSQKEVEDVKIAKALFNFPFIKAIFINTNFISITKTKETKWDDMAIQLRAFITDFLNEHGIPDHTDNTNKKTEKLTDQCSNKTLDLSEDEEEIVSVLNQYIKPAIEADGGAIILDSFRNGVVKVILKGSCNGCPSSAITLKQGIETLLKEKIGDKIKEVCAE